jgi:hypothetical protein
MFPFSMTGTVLLCSGVVLVFVGAYIIYRHSINYRSYLASNEIAVLHYYVIIQCCIYCSIYISQSA